MATAGGKVYKYFHMLELKQSFTT